MQLNIVILLISILLFFTSCSARAIKSPPNIIIILADDLGYIDTSPYNPQIDYTPNVQWLADNGTVLTQFYVPVPVCTPTRATLLTGRHPHTLEYYGLHTVLFPRHENTRTGLTFGNQTLAGQLRQRGYRTGIIGKWHLGGDGPLANGFDSAYWLPYGNATSVLELHDGETIAIFPDFSQLNEKFIVEVIDFVKSSKQPFFLYLPHIWPHVPLLNNKKGDLDYYQSAIAEVDDLLGAVLDNVDLDNTIIIFASDNGPYQPRLDENDKPIVRSRWKKLARDGIYPDADNPARWIGGQSGLRGSKGNVYEGGIRVPFIIYGMEAEDRLMQMTDVYYWLLDNMQPQRNSSHFYNTNGTYGAIRLDDWKLHFGEDFEPTELYWLRGDEKEEMNLISQYPDLVIELTDKAKQFDTARMYYPQMIRR